MHVEIRRDGHVAEIVFANPPSNHASYDLLRGLGDALATLDDDPDCRAIVLASEGKVFCAGADLGSAAGLAGLGNASGDPLRDFYDQALRIFAASKPVVAAVQGAAIGAGLGLAVAADFRIAGPDARFGANFVALGFHPGFGLSCTLPRLIGAQHAAMMCMTARRLKPAEAADWGLADSVAAEPRAAAHALAREIAVNAPLALLATRATLRRGLLAEVTAALIREHAAQSVLKDTADYAEGVRAVGDRRPGRFHGR